MFKWLPEVIRFFFRVRRAIKGLFTPKEEPSRTGPTGPIQAVAKGLMTAEVSQILDKIDKINSQHYNQYKRFKVKVEVTIIGADILIKVWRAGREVSRKIPLIDIIQYNILPKILYEMLDMAYIYTTKENI